MLYQRDIARMAGEGKDTKGMEDEYKTFLAELGGKDPRDLGSSGRSLYTLCPLILQPAAQACILSMPVKHVMMSGPKQTLRPSIGYFLIILTLTLYHKFSIQTELS